MTGILLVAVVIEVEAEAEGEGEGGETEMASTVLWGMQWRYGDRVEEWGWTCRWV